MLVLGPDKKLRKETKNVDLAKDRIDFTEEGSKLEVMHVLEPDAYDGAVMKSMYDSQLMKIEDIVA